MDKSQIDAKQFNEEEAAFWRAKHLRELIERLEYDARLSAMFPLAIAEVTKVAEFGAKKYKERGLAEDGFEINVREYSGHACDHWAEWRFNRTSLDPETRRHNLAHAIVRLTAILNQELKDRAVMRSRA